MYTGGTNWVFAQPPPLNRSPPKFSWGVLWRTKSCMPTAISVLPGVPGWQQSKNWPGPFTTYITLTTVAH